MSNKIQKGFGYFLKIGTVLSTFCFIMITLIQIYARFFMTKAPSWTEEAARLFFVFAMAFGAGLAMKTEFYVSFDFIFNKFSESLQFRLKQLSYIVIVIVCISMIYYGFAFIINGINEQSPSMKFSMAIPFASMPLLGFVIGFYAVSKLIESSTSKTKIK